MGRKLRQAEHNEELLKKSEERLSEIRDCIVRIYSESKIGCGIKESSFQRLIKSAGMNKDVFDRLDEYSKTIDGREVLNKFIFKD